jgi:serine phosphatase RsbU (regulator of sigma subunit)
VLLRNGVPDSASSTRLVRGLVAVAVTIAVSMIAFLWWGLFSLPTDQVGGVTSLAGLEITRLNVPVEETPLRPGDVLHRLRGRTMEEWSQLSPLQSIALLRDSRVGQVVSHSVRRGEAIETIEAPLVRVRPADGLQSVALVLPIAAAFLVVGAFVVWRRPRDPAARVLFVCFLAIVLNLIDDSANEINTSWLLAFYQLSRLFEFVTFWLSVSTALHFSLLFPQPHPWVQRHPWLLWAIHLANPLLSTMVALASGEPVMWNLASGSGEGARYVLGAFMLAWAIANLAYNFRSARTLVAQAQIRWLAWGTIVGIGPWVIGFVAPLVISGSRWGAIQTALVWLCMLAIPLAFAFAILRYHLMDIDTVVNRSLVYVALSAVLVGLYLLLTAALSRLFLALSGRSSDTTVVLLSTLGAATAFAPARTRIQALIDRTFYRQEVYLPALLAEWGRILATTLDLGSISDLLTETIPAQLGLAHARIWLYDSEAERFVTPGGQVLIQGEPACALLAAVTRADGLALVNPAASPGDPALAVLRAYQAEIAVLLSVSTKPVGLYTIGAKQSGAWFKRAEIEALKTLSYQAAIALENSLLLRRLAEQERMKRELEIARSIQTSLLPAENPTWPGLDVYGLSLPARQVGGDFYSFLTLDGDAVAVAVGDVSGKGVPGALFMAVALGVIRAQAAAFSSAAQLLQTLNSALYEQMAATHMNVGLLYTILRPGRSTSFLNGAWSACVSNGGLVAPLLLRRNGACDYVDISGLPLGATLQAQYGQVEITLSAGDALVLCSDGLVEAMDGQRQLFSFDRVRHKLAELCRHSAEEIARGLIESARAFAEAGEFIDDATLVVIKNVSGG